MGLARTLCRERLSPQLAVPRAVHLCVHVMSTSLEAPPDDIPAPVRFPAS